MVKKTVLYIIIVMCVIFMGMNYYLKQNNSSSPPEINVKVNDKEINTVVGLNRWNGAKYDREDTLKAFLKEYSKISYFQMGDTISIQFPEIKPDIIVVTDVILTEAGEHKYSNKVTQSVELIKEDEIYRFQLKPNLASYLSSKLSDYEKGNIIRGFRILCNWGENECEYGFVIRTDASSTQVDIEDTNQEDIEVFHSILPDGNKLSTRIAPLKGYKRTEEDADSFTTFMRNLPLKKNGSPVLLYDGEQKNNQNVHIAVFDMDIGEKDLQQCADSIMRMYAEYYWSNSEYDKIAFHLTNNFLMDYNKWRDGYRLSVNGNQTSWVKTASFDETYDTFRKYLDTVFMYAGTLSLAGESEEINLNEMQAGDMFIKAGSPGHCVLIVDLAVNEAGEKAFLLAQGYMPAQEFHILKNPLHDEDPWYYSSEIEFPFKTPQWTFEEGSLKRWMK